MGALEILSNTSLSTQIRESALLYPWIQTIHLLAICVFLSTIIVADLILLGAIKDTTLLSPLVKNQKLQAVGLFATLVTGLLLFVAVPERTFHSIWFRGKMLLLICSLINGFYLLKKVEREVSAESLPRLKRFALLSLILWGSIICFGKLIPYRWFDCQYLSHPLMLWITQCP